MKKVSVLKLILVSVLTLSLMAMYSCQKGGEKGEGQEEKQEDREVTILYPNWAEGIAFTHLAKAALEDKGIKADVKAIEPGPIYASLAKGDADFFMDAWLPNTHADYWEKYGDKLEKIGESFSGGTTGLVVPQYVEVNSIAELNDNVDKFNGKIYGIGSGAGIHANTDKVIEAYGLDYEQVTSSGSAMMAALQKAYNKQEPVIVTGWKPHFKWANFDLKYLEDPKGIYPKDVCAIVTRKGFEADYPEITSFLKSFNMKEMQLYDLMGKIKESDDTYAAAQEWYNSHKVLVESWMPESWTK